MEDGWWCLSFEVGSISFFTIRKKGCYHNRLGRSYHDFWSVVISVDLFDYRIAMFQSRSGVAFRLTLDEVSGDLDLYVYFNIEMAIVRLQWVSFAAMPSRTSNPLIVVTVGSSGVFCHSVVGVIGLSSSLLLVFGLYVICILHCSISYTNLC